MVEVCQLEGRETVVKLVLQVALSQQASPIHPTYYATKEFISQHEIGEVTSSKPEKTTVYLWQMDIPLLMQS